MRRPIAALVFCALGALALVPGQTRDAGAQPAPAASPEARAVWTPDARSNVDSLIGWPSGASVGDERAWEDRFEAIPSSENAADIENHLSAVPYRAGTPADYATALYVRARLRAGGFEARFDPFEVFYTNPLEQKRELLAGGPTARSKSPPGTVTSGASGVRLRSHIATEPPCANASSTSIPIN